MFSMKATEYSASTENSTMTFLSGKLNFFSLTRCGEAFQGGKMSICCLFPSVPVAFLLEHKYHYQFSNFGDEYY